MNLPGSDEQHAVAIAATAASPIAVWSFAGPAWAIALVLVAVLVAAITVAVSRRAARAALLRFLWSRLPRGRRHLPPADRHETSPARSGDRP